MACSKRSLLLAVCLGAASIVNAVAETVSKTIEVAYTACAHAVNWLIERIVPAAVKAQDRAVLRAPVQLAQARAFVLRLAKRETPRVTPGWRMCPST